MTIRRMSAVFAAAALTSAVAGGAWAADKPAKPVDFTVRSEPTTLADKTSRTYKYDASKGRFGFTLQMQQSETRAVTPNDVQAGAYFRITPKLRIGGAVALGEREQPQFRKTEPVEGRPRVRLETAFKF